MKVEKKNNIPVIALIGLPNSGKSTLINRLGSTRKAVTANEEGTTRDLNWSDEIWEGLYMSLVDTGGLMPDTTDKINKLVQVKTYSAISKADLLVWVFDRKTNIDSVSLDMMQRIWKSGKPFIIAVNKVDNPNTERNISDYAHLGGVDFINISASSGYNLGVLMDSIVENCVKIGFQKGNYDDIPSEILTGNKTRRKKNALRKIVKQNKDGSYYVVREDDEKGAPGTFRTLTEDEIDGFEKQKKNEIGTLIFDFWDVIYFRDVDQLAVDLVKKYKLSEDKIEEIEDEFTALFNNKNWKNEKYMLYWNDNFAKITGGYVPGKEIWEQYFYVEEEMLEWVKELKESGKYQLYYLTNNPEKMFGELRQHEIFEYFDGGISSHETNLKKPDLDIFKLLINKFDLEPEKCILIDDLEENIEAAKKLGFWGIEYKDGFTNLPESIGKILHGEVERITQIPKVLFLGKPNVGKSTLFNAMVGEEIQIVSDIAGTTLSVNDTLVERSQRRVKPGSEE